MSWPTTPARFVLTEVDERGLRPGEDGELLSVSIGRGVVPRSESGSTQAASEDTSQYKRCEPGQLALNRLRAFQGGIGVSDHLGLVSPDYAVFDIDASMDPRFVHYQTRSSWFVAEMTKRLRGIGDPGTSNVRTPRINVVDLGRIDMFTPPLDVQRKIADRLDAETERIDRLIAMNRQVLETIARRVQSLTDNAFLPHMHRVAPLGYRALVMTSGIDKHTVDGQRQVRLCNYTDVYYSNEITDSSPFMEATCSNLEFDRLHLLPGDVVMTKDSETANDIAIPAVVRVSDPNLVLGYHNALLRPLPGGPTSDWLYWFLRTRVARDFFGLKARGVTRVGLRVEDIAGLRIPEASRPEQESVVGKLWEAEAKSHRLAARVQEQIELLETRRRSLVTAAVTGQIDA